jgi:hypothetical protein
MGTHYFFPGISTGLTNKHRPDSLPRSSREGWAAVRKCLNLTHDQDGTLRTRQCSRTVLDDAEYIPLLPLPGDRFYAARHLHGEGRTELVTVQMLPDGGMVRAKIKDCAHYGETWGCHSHAGACWASSASEGHILLADAAIDWPDYQLDPDDNQYAIIPMPMSPLTERWGACLVAAAGGLLWRSEPFRENLCRQTTSAVPFSGNITLLAAVPVNGLYVGTADAVWFLQWADTGDQLVPENNYLIKKVWQYGAIPGSRCMSSKWLLRGSDVGIDSDSLGAVFQTTDSVVWGGPDGQVVKIEDSISYPEDCSSAGATMWIKGKLIHSRK